MNRLIGQQRQRDNLILLKKKSIQENTMKKELLNCLHGIRRLQLKISVNIKEVGAETEVNLSMVTQDSKEKIRLDGEICVDHTLQELEADDSSDNQSIQQIGGENYYV